MTTTPSSTFAGGGTRLLPALGVLSALGLPLGHWFIWNYAPVESSMGPIQKIFYIHLPLAWWAIVAFFGVFVMGVLHLRTKKPIYDRASQAFTEIGVLFAGLALCLGSIWARFAWGVWWTWDPKLTTTLIMWFIYAGLLVLRGLDASPGRKAIVCALVGIVAFLDVPLVFYASKLWPRSIHPPSIGLEPEMRTTLFVNLAVWIFPFAAALILRIRGLALGVLTKNLATHDSE